MVSGELGPYYSDDIPHRMAIAVDQARAFRNPLPTIASTGTYLTIKMYVGDLDKSYEDIVGSFLDGEIPRGGMDVRGRSDQRISECQVSRMVYVFCCSSVGIISIESLSIDMIVEGVDAVSLE